MENLISEAVKFFHLDALSSLILIKIHFDGIMSMVADTKYNTVAEKIRDFEDSGGPKINDQKSYYIPMAPKLM